MTAKFPEQRIAIFPGSFDPFTRGHLDIVERGLDIFDRIIVAVGVNSSKQGASSTADRIAAITRAVARMSNVDVIEYTGLTVDVAKKYGACAILRGIRSVADFEYERNLAELNRKISGIETVMLCADPALAALSSSAVRELRSLGHDVSPFLP
ncbi:MAG: pantetheine-phosphate adenylyltransferase [Bacteroidales bacterium]|nr:pantetheine-phosphate adenylyltransferase [Bacteroidales bacterium]MBD5256220.1 pantetheine-phosphate adenylyltransferase [Bacteroides sp.]MDE5821321.1 pantetheine-phosphate adenylyltransferase [Paramuribaculum sp.]MDE5837215.1 pantetheine-phosphate adenylyltransferase [Paramuribaculum sp.]